MSVIVRVYTPADLSGRLICWRLESQYCHAAIEIDGTIYTATFPKVSGLPPTDASVGQPPRGGQAFALNVTDEQKATMLRYCTSMLGSSYDVLAILGWALRLRCMQRPNHVYCFEYVYDALAAAGVFPTSKRLVTGDELIVDMFRSGVVSSNASGKFGMIMSEALSTRINKPGFEVPSPRV